MNTIIIAVIIVVLIGLIAGIGLSAASVALEVPQDENVQKVRNELPGANCGGCGYSGCDAYAEAVASGTAPTNLCAPGGADAAKKLSEIMGTDCGEFISRVANVKCNGNCEATSKKYNYRGIKGCAAVNTLLSGDKSCAYGCLGGGDCVNACPNDCIKIVDGIAKIDKSLCIGCGKCVDVCPKSIIELVPKEIPHYMVLCSNKEKGAVARKECKTACIGCGICAKLCEFDAIEINDNLAVIDPEKCTACGKCAEKCPQKCIVKF